MDTDEIREIPDAMGWHCEGWHDDLWEKIGRYGRECRRIDSRECQEEFGFGKPCMCICHES